MSIITLIKVNPAEVLKKFNQGYFKELPNFDFKIKADKTSFKTKFYTFNTSDPIHKVMMRNNTIEIVFTSGTKAQNAFKNGTLEELERECCMCKRKYKGSGLPIIKEEEEKEGKVIFHGIGSYCYSGFCTKTHIENLYKPNEQSVYIDRLYKMWNKYYPDMDIPDLHPMVLIENDGCLEYEDLIRKNRVKKLNGIIVVPAREVFKIL